MIYQSSMCHYLVYVIIAITSIPITLAIKVDWNTNHGPIIPPTSTVRPEPKKPYREPAPVWENQNDIPNPNQYKYILPPPSRPRYNDVQQPSTSSSQSKSTTLPEAAPTYGTIIQSYNSNVSPQQTKPVNGLTVQYIPNHGNKYVGIVPTNYPSTSKQSNYYTPTNFYGDKYDKLNGKYNPKLKKYKAYEQKVKFVPYYEFFAPKQQYIYYKHQQQQNSEKAKHWSLNTNRL